MEQRLEADRIVQAPATGIVVTGVLNASFAFLGLAGDVLWGLLGYGSSGPREDELAVHGIAFLVLLFMFFAALLLIYAGLRMRKRRSYGLAVVSAVIAMVPVVSPCCPLGIIFGGWALMALSRPEVRVTFD